MFRIAPAKGLDFEGLDSKGLDSKVTSKVKVLKLPALCSKLEKLAAFQMRLIKSRKCQNFAKFLNLLSWIT